MMFKRNNKTISQQQNSNIVRALSFYIDTKDDSFCNNFKVLCLSQYKELYSSNFIKMIQFTFK